MRVELRDEATEDLVRGSLFYASQSPGLDDYFLECIGVDLKRLATTAGIHEVCWGFHRTLARRFPFAIYYLVQNDHVDVVAILDCRQNPAKILERLKQTKR